MFFYIFFHYKKKKKYFIAKKFLTELEKKFLANLFSANPTYESFSEWKDIFGNDRKCFIFASFTKK